MKHILKGLLALFVAVVLLVVGYFSYVLILYQRIDDHQVLEIMQQTDMHPSQYLEFSMMTWNLGYGAFSADYSYAFDGGSEYLATSDESVKQNINEMAKVMKSTRADFILTQGIDIASNRSYNIDEESMLHRVVYGYDYHFAINYNTPYVYYPISKPYGKSKGGTMTMSQYVMDTAERISLPMTKGLDKTTEPDCGYTVSKITLDTQREFYLYNVQLSKKSSSTIVKKQLELLFQDMYEKYNDGAYIICAGDFGMSLISDSKDETIPTFPKEILPSWLTIVTGDNTPSYRLADKPYGDDSKLYTTDGFLVSENINVLSVEVLDQKFAHSNHNPVLLKFGFIDYR